MSPHAASTLAVRTERRSHHREETELHCLAPVLPSSGPHARRGKQENRRLGPVYRAMSSSRRPPCSPPQRPQEDGNHGRGGEGVQLQGEAPSGERAFIPARTPKRGTETPQTFSTNPLTEPTTGSISRHFHQKAGSGREGGGGRPGGRVPGARWPLPPNAPPLLLHTPQA